MATTLSEYELEALPELESEYEWEGAHEGAHEWEAELNPIRRVYPDAMLEMEHLGHLAASAESEAEAGEAFLPLIPLAFKALPMLMKAAPKAMKLLNRVGPRVVRGLTRSMARNPRTRPLTRTIPTIVRRAGVDLARQAAQGRPVTPRSAQLALARQSRRVLTNPTEAAQIMRRARVMDRQYHRAVATGTMHCTCTPICPNCGRLRK